MPAAQMKYLGQDAEDDLEAIQPVAAAPLSSEKQDKIRQAMGKLSLKKPLWAEKTPED